MSGISSKKGTISFALQTAKGAAATVPTVKFKLAADPSLGPAKSRGRYTQTDSSQDNGPAYTSLLSVEGGLSVYAHPDGLAFLFAAISGANVDDGLGGHVATPGDDMLWVTAWREVGGVIVEKFVDCKIHSLQGDMKAGQPLVFALEVLGCSASFVPTEGQAAIAAVQALSSHGYLYPEAMGRIKLNGQAKKIHQVSLGINRNASGYQADGYTFDDIDPGSREVTLSYVTRFGSGAVGVAEYREFHYGSADGTEQSPEVATRPFEIEFVRDADHSFKIVLPSVTYAAVPVNPGTSGEPIEVQVACEVERPADGVTPIYTITTNDGFEDLEGTPVA